MILSIYTHILFVFRVLLLQFPSPLLLSLPHDQRIKCLIQKTPFYYYFFQVPVITLLLVIPLSPSQRNQDGLQRPYHLSFVHSYSRHTLQPFCHKYRCAASLYSSSTRHLILCSFCHKLFKYFSSVIPTYCLGFTRKLMLTLDPPDLLDIDVFNCPSFFVGDTG